MVFCDVDLFTHSFPNSIPLAKKLKDCGVFGKSSDELLNYALQNREEWEVKGHQVVSEMLESINNEGKLKDEEPSESATQPFGELDGLAGAALGAMDLP